MANTVQETAHAERVPRSRSLAGRATVDNLTPYGWAFGVAGIFFVLYPAIRPFSNEVDLDGARAFGSSSWVVAHTLGILGFVLLALGALEMYLRLRGAAMERRALRSLVLLWIGVGLTLPYYGAEVFSLHAVGQHALAQNNPGMVKPLAHDIRWEAGIWFIITGLVLLAIRGRPSSPRPSGGPARCNAGPASRSRPGSRFTSRIPQFTGPQSIRIAHGLLMLAGCSWLGWSLMESPRRSRRDLNATLSRG